MSNIKESKPINDTFWLLSNSRITYHTDTIQLHKTTFKEFQQIFSINTDSLPQLEAPIWEGSVMKEGKLSDTGGVYYIQTVKYKDLEFDFRSAFSKDSLVLEGMTLDYGFPCDRNKNTTILFFESQNISVEKPQKVLNILLSSDRLLSHVIKKNETRYYSFGKQGLNFMLFKCGKFYLIRRIY